MNSDKRNLPAVSIVVITKDRRDMLVRAIESISISDYPAHLREIIVLEETNEPLQIEKENLKYHTIPNLNRGFGYARNYALKFVSHNIIVFVDDDCIVKTDWLQKLLKPLIADKNVVAVAGAVSVPKCGTIGKCENILGFPGGGLNRDRYFFHL